MASKAADRPEDSSDATMKAGLRTTAVPSWRANIVPDHSRDPGPRSRGLLVRSCQCQAPTEATERLRPSLRGAPGRYDVDLPDAQPRSSVRTA